VQPTASLVRGPAPKPRARNDSKPAGMVRERNHVMGRAEFFTLPGLPYALAADNFCPSSFVSFTSATRNKGGSCSGIRALAMGATTVG
jgi:hypothetical protein